MQLNCEKTRRAGSSKTRSHYPFDDHGAQPTHQSRRNRAEHSHNEQRGEHDATNDIRQKGDRKSGLEEARDEPDCVAPTGPTVDC